MKPLFRIGRRAPAIIAICAMTALAACSGFNISDVNTPKLDFRPLATNDPVTSLGIPATPVTADQLVGPDGSCATGAQSAGAGVSLGMTECDVVGRLGLPENIEVAANERGVRAVNLVYTRNERPGIYRFAAGRLTVIDRAPEPAVPVRPAKQVKKAVKKKPARIARPARQPPPAQTPAEGPPPDSVWPPPPR